MSTEDLLFEGSGQTETEARGLAAKQFLDHIYRVRTQWGSEYQTSSVFIWSKKEVGCRISGIQMPFKYQTARLFEYLTNGSHLVFLCTGQVFEWLV